MDLHPSQPYPHRRAVVRPLGCSGCLSALVVPMLGIPFAGGILTLIEWSHAGSDEAAVAAFAACPAVTAALGTPLQEATFSMGCGEYEGGGSSGEAEWTITIEGPKGRASGYYEAEYHGGGPWTVRVARLTLPDGQTILAVPCTSAPSPSPNPSPAPTPAPDRAKRKGKGKRD